MNEQDIVLGVPEERNACGESSAGLLETARETALVEAGIGVWAEMSIVRRTVC